MRTQVQSLALLTGLRIDPAWPWAVMQAADEARSYSSNSTPSLGNSLCHRFGPKRPKTKKKSKRLQKPEIVYFSSLTNKKKNLNKKKKHKMLVFLYPEWSINDCWFLILCVLCVCVLKRGRGIMKSDLFGGFECKLFHIFKEINTHRHCVNSWTCSLAHRKRRVLE